MSDDEGSSRQPWRHRSFLGGDGDGGGGGGGSPPVSYGRDRDGEDEEELDEEGNLKKKKKKKKRKEASEGKKKKKKKGKPKSSHKSKRLKSLVGPTTFPSSSAATQVDSDSDDEGVFRRRVMSRLSVEEEDEEGGGGGGKRGSEGDDEEDRESKEGKNDTKEEGEEAASAAAAAVVPQWFEASIHQNQEQREAEEKQAEEEAFEMVRDIVDDAKERGADAEEARHMAAMERINMGGGGGGGGGDGDPPDGGGDGDSDGDDEDPEEDNPDRDYMPIPLPGTSVDVMKILTPAERRRDMAALAEPHVFCYACWVDPPPRSTSSEPTAHEILSQHLTKNHDGMSHAELCKGAQDIYLEQVMPQIEDPEFQKHWAMQTISDHLLKHAPSARIIIAEVLRENTAVARVLVDGGVLLKHRGTGKKILDLRSLSKLLTVQDRRVKYAKELMALRGVSIL